jgi:hypothetical protein
MHVAHVRGVGSAHVHSACAARSHAGARPTATRARPALAGPASAGAARAARGGSARRRTARRRLGTGAREMAGAAAHRRGDGDGRWRRVTVGARQQPAAVRATRLRTAAVGARAVGTTAARARRRSGGVALSGKGGAVRSCATSTRRGERAGAECGATLLGRATRGPNSGLKPRCRRGTWRPRGSGARMSAISELKFTPKEISSN